MRVSRHHVSLLLLLLRVPRVQMAVQGNRDMVTMERALEQALASLSQVHAANARTSPVV